MALAPLDFGRFSHDLLVGQFAGGGTTESSGFIAAYDLATGKFDGLLLDASGKPLAINGIWSLSPANISPSSADPDEAPAAGVYFTAAEFGSAPSPHDGACTCSPLGSHPSRQIIGGYHGNCRFRNVGTPDLEVMAIYWSLHQTPKIVR